MRPAQPASSTPPPYAPRRMLSGVGRDRRLHRARVERDVVEDRALAGAPVHIGIKFEVGQSQSFREAVQASTRYVRQRLVERAKGERRIALRDLSQEAAA